MGKCCFGKIKIGILTICALVLFFYIFKYFGCILFPFVFGFFMAYMMNVITDKIKELTGLNSKTNRIFCLMICYCVFIVVIFLFSKWIVSKVSNYIFEFVNDKMIIGKIVNFLDGVISLVGNESNNEILGKMILSFKSTIESILSKTSIKLTSLATEVAIKIPEMFFSVTVAIITSFFAAIDFDMIKKFILGQIPLKAQKRILEIKNLLSCSVFKMIKCYVVIFFITFIELFVGFALLKVSDPFVVAILIAIADILPIIGTGTVLIPWSIIAFFEKNIAFSIGIIALFFISIVVRNIVEPKLIGEKLGLHPIVSLLCLYIGLKIGGVMMAIVLPFTVIIIKYLNENNLIRLYNNV